MGEAVMRASAEVLLKAPDDMMRRICAHFAEFGEVNVTGRCGRIETGFGTAGLEACDACLKLSAEGRDDTALAYVKLALAEHLLQFAGSESPRIVWKGDGEIAGAPLPYFREMRVVRSVFLTPHMKRLTLAGDNLARFAHGGLHVRLLFPKDRTRPCWPTTGEDGRPAWPQGPRPDVRIYTIRRIDVEKGEIDIDFVLHEGSAMPGACFAAEALPGDLVGMTGPGGGTMPPADWYLLAGDETALPAIGRMLEDMPATAQAVVRIEVDSLADCQPLHSAAALDLQWLSREGRPAGTTALLEQATRVVRWPQPGVKRFVWVGCEYSAFRAIRDHMRQERNLQRDEHLVVAYWRRGAEGDSARSDND